MIGVVEILLQLCDRVGVLHRLAEPRADPGFPAPGGQVALVLRRIALEYRASGHQTGAARKDVLSANFVNLAMPARLRQYGTSSQSLSYA